MRVAAARAHMTLARMHARTPGVAAAGVTFLWQCDSDSVVAVPLMKSVDMALAALALSLAQPSSHWTPVEDSTDTVSGDRH